MKSATLSQSMLYRRYRPGKSIETRIWFKRLAAVLIFLTCYIVAMGNHPAYAESDDALFIDQNGNVGIGTQNPEKKLDVNGKVKAMGFEGDGAVPKGVIVMWSGKVDEIPAGWSICDGGNGTPDLRSRFIVGAGPGEGSSYAPRASGDPDKLPDLSVDTNREGDHQHKFPANYYDRKFRCDGSIAGAKWCTGIDTRGKYKKNQPTQPAGSHSHTVVINFNEANSGENRPRWFALCFIMKK